MIRNAIFVTDIEAFSISISLHGIVRPKALRSCISKFIQVQLKKCETGPYFFQNFQCETMFISVLCKSCEPMLCEPEIVLGQPHWHQLQIFWTISGSHNTGSQLLQNTEITKQTDVLLWKIRRIYGSVLYLFSCTANRYCYFARYSKHNVQSIGWSKD